MKYAFAVFDRMAAFAADATDPGGLLTTFGPLGVFAMLMIAAIKVMWGREKERADTTAAELRELRVRWDRKQEELEEKLVPALVKVTDAMEQYGDLLVEMHAFVRDNIRPIQPPPAALRRKRPTSTEGD